MKALVTGGAGFIGHHLVRHLLERGDEVSVIDDLSTGNLDRLGPFRDRATIVTGSILDAAALDVAIAGCEVVFHEAALPSVARSVRAPRATNAANTDGTIEVMLAAGRAGVRRVVYAGSSSVYGQSPELPRRETQVPDPRSPYATSKLAGEGYVHSLGDLHGVETVVLRYFNVFGPGQDPASEYAAVIPRFVMALLRGERPQVFGDGSVSRDFTYIDNVVDANLLAAEAPGATQLTCNIGCGDRQTLLDLLRVIGEILGVEADPIFSEVRAGDVPHSQADIGVARQRLGYRPRIDLREGLERTVAWYRDTVEGSGAR
jgi:UDP-glucose 4-epimerase